MNAEYIKKMSDQEIVSSYIMYTATGAMNMKIRNGARLTSEDIARKDRLSAAIKALPVFQGVTYRKVRLYDESWIEDFAAWHKVGGIVKYDEFLSSSASQEFAENFKLLESKADSSIDDFEVILKIHSKHGRTYMNLFPGAENDEEEVLFDCGSQFIVVSVSENGRSIELEEI